jgi:hypothetical protein
MGHPKTPPPYGPGQNTLFDKWNAFVKKQKEAGMKTGEPLPAGTVVPQYDGPPAPIKDDTPKPPGSTDGTTPPATPPEPIHPEKIGPVPQQPDPDHPDIYVPPNAGPGQAQELLRWDKNVGSYCIIGSKNMSNSVPQDQWYMLDPKDYAGTNEEFLKSAGANAAVPPKGPKNHPDFSVPPDGDGVIVRWDETTKKWTIVGETVNGKKVYFPNQATAKMADNVNIPTFGGDGPRPPLPAPTKGTEPQWGSDPAHPSFFGKNDQNDGKIYMWSWNAELGRYTAVGEMVNDGQGETAHVYSLSEYRQKNSGPDGLRPDKNDIPAPLPTPDPYSAVDAPKAPPEIISILVPPDYKSAGDGKKMVKITGEAVYRKDQATGKWVIVGVDVKGNPNADPPTDDQIYYLRPDEFQNFNPGGEAKKLEPAPASATAAQGPTPDLDKDKVTQSLIDSIVEQEEAKGHHHPGNKKGNGSVTFTDEKGKEWTLKLGGPLTDDAKKLLKSAGYY